MRQLQESFDAILSQAATQKTERAAAAERNRALMAEHMPDCLGLIDDLKAFGMFGRVIEFHVNRPEAA